MKKTLLALTIIAGLGTGCAGMSNASNGALAGGLLGALAGQALGHDTKATLIGTEEREWISRMAGLWRSTTR